MQEPNPGYAGQYLTGCCDGSNCFFQSGTNLFNPNYKSPRSVVMNLGIQRELHPGMALSVDLSETSKPTSCWEWTRTTQATSGTLTPAALTLLLPPRLRIAEATGHGRPNILR